MKTATDSEQATPMALPPARGSADDCCPDWTPQTKLIDSYIVLQAARSGQHSQFADRGGKQFRYCPWCGKPRPQNDQGEARLPVSAVSATPKI